MKGKKGEHKIPPGPKGKFFLGHLLDFVKDPLTFFTRCNREFGDIVSILPPTGHSYLITHPEFIEQILVTEQRNFAKPSFYQFFRPLLGNGLALSQGDFWLKQRRLAQPAFHRERIHAYGEVMVKYTTRMLDKWQGEKTYDIDRSMHQVTMENVAKVLFDADIASASDMVSREFKIVLGEIQSRLNNPFQLPSFIPTARNKRYKNAVQSLENLIYKISSERRASKKDTGDLLSMYLHAQDEDGSQMTDSQLRDEMMTLILGGHETTANALTWTWYLLSEHPEVEKRLWQELDEVLGNRVPTVSDLPKLRYTEMVLKECMRVYPPVWLFGREAIEDCEIGGYHVPAGKQIWFSPWVPHRDPRFFKDPEQFIPERWESEEIKNLPKFAYLPFGGGPRQCIGNVFAMMEATLMVATIAQRYQLKLEPGQTIEPQALVTLRPKYGLKMRAIARKPVVSEPTAALEKETIHA